MATLASNTYSGLYELHNSGMHKDSRVIGNNTTSSIDRVTDIIIISLHGSDIVFLYPDGTIEFTLAGWPTVTTRERVNHFLRRTNAYVHQHKYEQFVSFGTGNDIKINSRDHYVVLGAGFGESPNLYNGSYSSIDFSEIMEGN